LQWDYLVISKGTDKIATLSRTVTLQRLYNLMTNTRKNCRWIQMSGVKRTKYRYL